MLILQFHLNWIKEKRKSRNAHENKNASNANKMDRKFVQNMKLQWTFYSTYAIYNCRIFGIENQKRTRFCNEFRFCSGLGFGNFLEANACRIDQFLSSCCRKGEEIRSMVSSFSVCVEKKRGREREYCRFFYPVEEMRPWRASLSRRYSKKFRPRPRLLLSTRVRVSEAAPVCFLFFFFLSLGGDQNFPIGLIPFVLLDQNSFDGRAFTC